MTAKDKAKELFDKFQISGSKWYVDQTKKYALICVDEILENDYGSKHQMDFWKEVKQEINKL